jgi:hypothetical protein
MRHPSADRIQGDCCRCPVSRIARIQAHGRLKFPYCVLHGLLADMRQTMSVAEVGAIRIGRDRFGVGLFGFGVVSGGAV